MTRAIRFTVPIIFVGADRLNIKPLSPEEHDRQQVDGTTLELEVALKSLLMELPPVGWSLRVFFVADSAAAARISQMLARSGLNRSIWRIPVTISIIDVSSMVGTMRHVIQSTFAFRDYRTYHAFGQWFRFFLPWLLPADVSQTIYLDPDVWCVVVAVVNGNVHLAFRPHVKTLTIHSATMHVWLSFPAGLFQTWLVFGVKATIMPCCSGGTSQSVLGRC